MGGWQRGELKDADVIYLIGMQNGGAQIKDDELPTVEALNQWTQELNFTATHLLLDPKWEVINRYFQANPWGTWSQAVTAIYDRGMKIRRIGDTYDNKHDTNLTLLKELLAE
ncbi:MAG: hypothetical protein V3V08_09790 [Nannocystaceae bacterium]